MAPAEVDRFVVLLRHGIAEDPGPGQSDADRSLTSEGHANMKQIARGLAEALPRADRIVSSPLLRAVQTAQWVSKGYRSRAKAETSDALAPGSSPDAFLELLSTLPARRVIFVGHEPVLTNALRALTHATIDNLGLQPGGAYGVRIAADGRAGLEWMLPPRLLLKLVES